jgi:hypothetical protein
MAAVNEDSHLEAEDEEDKVDAFQNKWNNRFQNKARRTSMKFQLRFNSVVGNNTNWNGKYCFYCKIQNHMQEECWKRIRENKPCKDRQGCLCDKQWRQ